MIKKEVAQATSFFVRILRLHSIEIKQKILSSIRAPESVKENYVQRPISLAFF